jgi:hypothetical protein
MSQKVYTRSGIWQSFEMVDVYADGYFGMSRVQISSYGPEIIFVFVVPVHMVEIIGRHDFCTSYTEKALLVPLEP